MFEKERPGFLYEFKGKINMPYTYYHPVFGKLIFHHKSNWAVCKYLAIYWPEQREDIRTDRLHAGLNAGTAVHLSQQQTALVSLQHGAVTRRFTDNKTRVTWVILTGHSNKHALSKVARCGSLEHAVQELEARC